MSIPKPESLSPQPSRRFRFFSFRTLGWLLASLAALITLLALFYAEEDWRGKHAWQKYRSELLARGVVLDLDKFTPPPVPDDRNFAMTPFLAPLFDLYPEADRAEHGSWRDTNGLHRAQNFATNFAWADSSLKAASVMGLGQLTALDEMASNLWKQNKFSAPAPRGKAAAQAILDNMKQHDPVLEEIRAASQRAHARFNVPYDDENPAGIVLPHLAAIKKFTRVLQVRALAELAIEKNEAAAADLKLMDYLTASVSREPMLISHLVRFAMLGFSRQVIWEGIAEGRWNDAQLGEIQSRLRELDLMKDAQMSLQAERAGFGDKMFDYMRSHPRMISDAFAFGNNQPLGDVFVYAPVGWLYFEQVNYMRSFDERILPGLDLTNHLMNPREIDNNFGHPKATESGILPMGIPDMPASIFQHNVMMKLLLPALGKVYHKAAITQTAVNETLIACALERYRLANGKLPATLDALVPQYLDRVPLDICNGRPLVYRPGDGNQFVLYSVGWNEIDEGGTTVLTEAKIPDADQGDWVWPPYPAR